MQKQNLMNLFTLDLGLIYKPAEIKEDYTLQSISIGDLL